MKTASVFFRTIQEGGGLSKLDQSDAPDVLRNFFEQIGFDGCSADQLLSLADLAVRAREEDVAIEALKRVLAQPKKADRARYRLGRLDMVAKRYDAAALNFAEGIAANPDFPFNWIGKAHALHKSGKSHEAAPYAERFADFEIRPHHQEEINVLVQLADMLFEEGERKRSRAIYGLLDSIIKPTARMVARHAEALIADNRLIEALSLLHKMHSVMELDPWGLRALAFCESRASNHRTAVSVAESALLKRPGDSGFVATYVDVVVQSRDVGLLREAIAFMGTILPGEDMRELKARLYLEDGRLEDAFAMLDSVEFRPNTRLFWLGIEAAYIAIDANNTGMAISLASRLQAVSAGEIAPLLIQVDVSMRSQMWAEADAALARVPAEKLCHPDVLLKRFELACFTQDIELADSLLPALEAHSSACRQAILPILRYLAEKQKWDELVSRAVDWLGDDFRYEAIGYILFRAARRTRRHADLLSTIEAVEIWRSHGDLVRLHTLLAWDSAGSPADLSQLAKTAQAGPVMRNRMRMQQEMLLRAALPVGKRALFFCSDASYLCATIVALHSVLEHSTPPAQDVFLVVDDDLVERTGRVVEPFRARGFCITVVRAGEVIGAADQLSPAYGLFTSGHSLASAAYYRIYFARYLRMLGGYARAVYLDSDVLVRCKLNDLFTFGLHDHPLAARIEMQRPEVIRAIAHHRLADGQYFNSGVLLFDLASERLERALDLAVAAIADENTKLLFHDQCALNLGFRDNFQTLDVAWNTPISEQSELSELPTNASILHYLDRPKPWSAAYEGPYAVLWLEQWASTAEVIGPAAALMLLASAKD